jgi:hypothetical protein
MNRKFSYALALAVLMPAMGFTAQAADQAQTRDQARPQARDQTQFRDQDIYGYQMMTPQERDEHRAKLRAAKTNEEREQIRREQHDQMVTRAKERGLQIPDEPPRGAGGRAPGTGAGPGMGQGGPGMMGPGGGPGPGRGSR